MKIDVQVTREEIKALVIAEIERKFGRPQSGLRWVAYDYYGEMKLSQEEILAPETMTATGTAGGEAK